jgi:hypothetical protein
MPIKSKLFSFFIPFGEPFVSCTYLEHLQQCSVCEPPALEILDEVHQSNPRNPLEDFWDPENVHILSEPWKRLINTVRSHLPIHCSLFLIG